jgi:acid stress-induced BolA-like protein IbaG/YrbA
MGAGGKATKGRSRSEVKRILEKALKAVFPDDTVDVSDGYQDNIHILVVSRRFDGRTEAEKQDMIWTPIKKSELTEEEQFLISLALPLSPADIK